VGNLSLKEIREVLFEDSLSDLVVAGELCGPPLSLTPEQDLNTALLTFLQGGYGQMPVVEGGDGPLRILGLLRHEDVIAAYRDEIARRGQEA
jgi:CIC family chloride channel protein